MTPNPINTLETWGVLLVSRDGEQILLQKENENWSLPRVEIPTQERIAANINRAIQRDLGIPVISLYPVAPADSDPPAGDPYHAVAALPATGNSPPGNEWKFISSLTDQSFSRQLDLSAIRAFRAGLKRGEIERKTGPFLRPDWFTDVTRWIADVLRPHGMRLIGSFEQFNADCMFSLIRFETNGAAVWFKAVGADNSREFPITLALAQLCPARLPKILASNPEWRAWLAAETSGICLRAKPAAHLWEDAAANLARLQITSISGSDTLRSAGARDFTSTSLRSLAESFFAFCTTSPPASLASGGHALTGQEIGDIKSAVLDSLAYLEAVGLPNTVGHMDLNPGNIYLTETGCIFLDWAEAFIGNPFFSYEYLLQHFRQAVSPEVQEEKRFREAYLVAWRRVVASADLQAAISTAVPLAALFAYAATLWSEAMKRADLNIAREKYVACLIRKMRRLVSTPRTESVPS
jgi:Phosphotransferase enzyme family